MKRWKEAAKFGSGVTAWEAVVHFALFLSGQTVTLFGFDLTPTVNLVQTVVPGTLSVAMAWWAWAQSPSV